MNPPLGALPNTWERYTDFIDVDKQTFRCFSDNKIINLSQVNDNYLDCNDGSDEPGTAILSNGKFYCKNEGSVPKIINSWSVGDGICDCCDGSDELLNPHANCLNVCGPIKNQVSEINTTLKNNESQLIKTYEDNKEESTSFKNQPKFSKIDIQNSDNEIITEADINRVKFKYKTKNLSLIEYIFISLWKDFI